MARNLCTARQFCMICIEAAGWHRARFQSGPDRSEMSEHPRIRRGCEFGPAIRRREADQKQNGAKCMVRDICCAPVHGRAALNHHINTSPPCRLDCLYYNKFFTVYGGRSIAVHKT